MERILTIGAEQEYCSAPSVNFHDVLSRYNLFDLGLQTEFYSYMVEYNEMLYSTTTSIAQIELVLRSVKERIEEMAFKINEYLITDRGRGLTIYLSPLPLVTYGGIVFNGLHIHLNQNSVSLPLYFLKKVTAYFKYKLNNDMRFFFSHHLWGAYRNSSYNFKRKARFSPATVTSHGTVELRVFSYDDLVEKRINKLAQFIHTITTIKNTDTFLKVWGWEREEIEEVWERFVNFPSEIPLYDREYIFTDATVRVENRYDDDEEEEYWALDISKFVYCVKKDGIVKKVYSVNDIELESS